MSRERARRDHLYGGQAVIEGVMMRGGDHWAVAVRRPDESIHVESHHIESIAKRIKMLAKPGLRGVIALGQALSIGYRALAISMRESSTEEEQLSRGETVLSVAIALVFFIGVFIVMPAFLFGFIGRRTDSPGIVANALEGVFRVALLVGYLFLIGRLEQVRRLFRYHGAEHKTIAAYEHDEPLEPDVVGRYSTLHVRCGTNFLLIVMVLTIFVFALFGTPGLVWRVLSRIIAIPVIAGLAYEALRLGAKFPDSPLMRALMAPGLWLQTITTKPPDRGQIEVAIASFREVVRRETDRPAPAPGEGIPG